MSLLCSALYAKCLCHFRICVSLESLLIGHMTFKCPAMCPAHLSEAHVRVLAHHLRSRALGEIREGATRPFGLVVQQHCSPPRGHKWVTLPAYAWVTLPAALHHKCADARDRYYQDSRIPRHEYADSRITKTRVC